MTTSTQKFQARAPPPASPSTSQIIEVIGGLAAKHLGRRPRDDESLVDAGLDSLSAIDLRNSIQAALLSSSTLRLSSTIVYEQPTIAELAHSVAAAAPGTTPQEHTTSTTPASWRPDPAHVDRTSIFPSTASINEPSQPGIATTVNAEAEQRAQSILRSAASRLLPRIPGPDESLVEAGLDSLMSIEFRNIVQQASGLMERLPPTIVYDRPTLRQMTEFLVSLLNSQTTQNSRLTGPTTSLQFSDVPRATQSTSERNGFLQQTPSASFHANLPYPAAQRVTPPPNIHAELTPASHSTSNQTKADISMSASKTPLAITGIGCRLPGHADTPTAFWENLVNKVDCIVPVPHDRFDIDPYFDPVPGTEGKTYVDQAAFIDDIDTFDRSLFPGISPSQVLQMDPQQRLALQVAMQALHDAGYEDVSELKGSSTGVFVGVCSNDWHKVKKDESFLGGGFDVAGGANSMLANRISFEFGFKGPSMAIDTACSSSLYAADLARRAVINGQCDRALVIGVNLILSPDTFIGECQATMLSPGCRSRAFDDSADGFARGEGCAAILLEKPGQAKRPDAYAELVGSATNHDGRSASLLAPSGPAQTAVIRAALEEAGVSGEQVDYLEAHGTGTKVGDPLEFNAFKEALAPGRSPHRPLHIGAVKSNIGHLEGAAGIAGLVKAALVLQHATVPANLHFARLNSLIDTDGFPLVFPVASVPLEPTKELTASVSSWGFGGSNAHAVLSRAVHTRKPDTGVSREPSNAMARSVSRDFPPPSPQPTAGLVVMFTGQGSQSVDMARGLYR